MGIDQKVKKLVIKSMLDAGWAKNFAKENSHLIRRFRLEIDLDNLEFMQESAKEKFKAAKTDEARAKLILDYLYDQGFNKSLAGIDTREMFSSELMAISKNRNELFSERELKHFSNYFTLMIVPHQVSREIAFLQVSASSFNRFKAVEHHLNLEFITECASKGIIKCRDIVESDSLDGEMTLEALIQCAPYCRDYYSIPKELVTREMADAYFKHYPEAVILYGDTVTQEIADEAVARDFRTIAVIPKEMITRDMEFAALSRDHRLVKHIDNERLTEDFLFEVLPNNAEVVRLMDQAVFADRAKLERVVKLTRGRVLEYIHEKHIDFALFKMSFDMNKLFVAQLEKIARNDEYLRHMLKCDGQLYPLFARKYYIKMDESHLLLAMETYPMAAVCVDRSKLTQEFAERAVAADYRNFLFMPRELINESMMMDVLSQNGKFLQYVKEENRSPELCVLALTSGMEGLSYIPQDILDNASFKKVLKESNKEAYELIYDKGSRAEPVDAPAGP